MTQTSLTLLDRLKQEPDSQAWQLLVEIYSPLIRRWLRHQGVYDAEADDLVQEVLTVVVRKLPTFQRRDQVGAFRCWLRTITVNCLRAHWRSLKKQPQGTGDSDCWQMLNQLEDSNSQLSREWDREHDLHLTKYLLDKIRPGFSASTWKAFRQVTLEGKKPDEVAAELGITTNAVFIAKSRVLTRLREVGAGLID